MQLPASEASAANVASDFSIFEDVVLTKYVGKDSTVVIPDGIQVIATDAFKDNVYVKSVVIPKSVKEIQSYAFWGSGITNVTIGAGLEEIGDYAFANCKSLATVDIPENVKRIGLYAFEDNISLTDANITYKTMDIHDTAFDGCYRLVIHAPEGSYPYKYAQAFYQRQLEFNEYEDVNNFNPGDMNVGDGSGTSDGGNGTGSTGNGSGSNGSGNNQDGSSSESSIHFIYNPDGTVSALTDYSPLTGQREDSLGSTHVVGNQAVIFMDSTSPNVYSGSNPPDIGDGNGTNDGSGSDSGLGANDGSGVGSGSGIGDGVLDDSIIPKYTIVDGRIVADQAYYCNTNINYVVLPSTVKEVGQFAYARSSLSSIVLPNGLERISYGAFYHCKNLSSITIPDTVMVVEPNAFAHTEWVEHFYADADEGDFLINGGVLVAYKGDRVNVIIPDGVRSIAAEAFEGHTEIKTVEIPDSLVVIGEEAFYGCTSLSEINLDGSSVKYILDRAFKDTAIEKTVLPSALIEMGINAFDSDTVLFYLGSEPKTTHEASAERLSNAALRDMAYETETNTIDLTGKPMGVTVVGAESADNYGIEAYLEAAADKYILSVNRVYSNATLDKAKDRAEDILKDRSLIDPIVFEMELTDKSGIPITKLGKVGLTVAVPIPDSINADCKLTVLTVDRNGQLEELNTETVNVEGKKYVRFTTYHLSPFAIYSTGNLLGDGEMIEASESIAAMAVGPMTVNMVTESENRNVWQIIVDWIVGQRWKLPVATICVGVGLGLLFYRKKRIS